MVATGHLVRTESRNAVISMNGGFMAGCLSIVGNDKEVCNLAEDA